MRIIKITATNEIDWTLYPNESIDKKNRALCEMIGNECMVLEMVRPNRLYTDFGAIREVGAVAGEAVALLVDEEGRLKSNKMNSAASILYQTDIHGNPIMGNVLVIGLKWEGGGISFCGIDDNQFHVLYFKLQKLVERLKETEGLV